jgi:hypothetical protein
VTTHKTARALAAPRRRALSRRRWRGVCSARAGRAGVDGSMRIAVWGDAAMLMQQKLTHAVPAGWELRPEGTTVIADVAGRTGRIPSHARSGPPDDATAYLWLDAGQSWPFLRRFETISERALRTWLFVVAACCCWAMIMMMTDGTRPEEATRQMERLATQLEGTTIPAATANAVARVIGQPWYDCGHAACSAELADRNRAVRSRLKTLLASKGPYELERTANTTVRAPAAD